MLHGEEILRRRIEAENRDDPVQSPRCCLKDFLLNPTFFILKARPMTKQTYSRFSNGP
jgi:hypothetical protein